VQPSGAPSSNIFKDKAATGGASGDAGKSGVAAAAAAITSLVTASGGCHLIVLTRSALTAAVGDDWLLRRRRCLLTGVSGLAFGGGSSEVSGVGSGPWAPQHLTQASAFTQQLYWKAISLLAMQAFSNVGGVTTGLALVRGATRDAAEAAPQCVA
jgi:hypothetical protein